VEEKPMEKNAELAIISFDDLEGTENLEPIMENG